MSALLADLCAVAILAGVGYFIGGYWLGFAFGAGGMVAVGIALINARVAVAIALINAREDADCDGHAQTRMDDDGSPVDLGDWPFGKKEDKQ